MSKFYTVAQLNNAAKRVTTASEMLKKVLVSVAYQGVMHGQVDILSKLAFFEQIVGYKAAQKNLKGWLKLTPQILKANKLSVEAKSHYAELRSKWDGMTEDDIYAEIFLAAFPAKKDDKPEVTAQVKLMKYLDKVNTADFTEAQLAAMRELNRVLAHGKKVEEPEVSDAIEGAPKDNVED